MSLSTLEDLYRDMRAGTLTRKQELKLLKSFIKKRKSGDEAPGQSAPKRPSSRTAHAGFTPPPAASAAASSSSAPKFYNPTSPSYAPAVPRPHVAIGCAGGCGRTLDFIDPETLSAKCYSCENEELGEELESEEHQNASTEAEKRWNHLSVSEQQRVYKAMTAAHPPDSDDEDIPLGRLSTRYVPTSPSSAPASSLPRRVTPASAPSFYGVVRHLASFNTAERFNNEPVLCDLCFNRCPNNEVWTPIFRNGSGMACTDCWTRFSRQ